MKKSICNIVIFALLFIIGFCIVNGESVVEAFKQDDNPFVNKIDIVYYINLDHRTDRKEEILQEFEKVGIPSSKIVRIPGNYNKEYGDVGCSKSHIDALRKFSQSSHKNCILFEDDFVFTQSPKDVHEVINELFENNVNYDVCMLSANTTSSEDSQYPFLKKVLETQTASGYIVNKSFSDTLLKNYEEGVQQLEQILSKEQGERGIYCIDQYWKRLQPVSAWYEFHPKLGVQRESYSDIQHGVVNPNT